MSGHKWAPSPRGFGLAAATAAVTLVGGMVGQVSGVPGGAMLGAMLVVALYNVVTDGAARTSPSVRHVSRILVGTTIGSLVTASLLGRLGGYLAGVVLVTALIIGVGLVCGLLLHRLSGLPLSTSLLACAPGGLVEMTSLAESLGSRTEVVVGVHVVRKLLTLVVVVTLVLVVAK